MSFLSSPNTASNPFSDGTAILWSARPSPGSTPVGFLQWFDLGLPAPVLMRNSGTAWRLTSASVLIDDNTPAFGGNTLSEQIIKQVTVPGDLLKACNFFSFSYLASKDGAMGIVNPTRLRFGSSGTLTDTLLYSTGVWNSAASLMISGGILLRYYDDTNIYRQTPQFNVSLEVPSNLTVAFPAAFAVSDMSNDNILSLTVTMASEFETPTGQRLTVVGF